MHASIRTLAATVIVVGIACAPVPASATATQLTGTVDSAVVNIRTGELTLTGTVTCDQADTIGVYGILTQRDVSVQIYTSAWCDPIFGAAAWSQTVSGTFKPSSVTFDGFVYAGTDPDYIVVDVDKKLRATVAH